MMRAITLAAFALSVSLPAQGGVRWTTSLKTALQVAADRQTAVMVAVHVPGFRDSDEALEDHYDDRRIVDLSRETVNLLLTVVGGQPGDDVKEFLEKIELDPKAATTVPLHVFFSPADGGTVVSSVAHRVTAGELEWVWQDAVRRVRPDFDWKFDDRTVAPIRVKFGAPEAGTTWPQPANEDQVESAIKNLRSGWGGFGKATENYRVILSSDSAAARKFGRTELRRLPGGFQGMALSTIGSISPRVWSDFVLESLDDRRTSTRDGAARALESLADPKANRKVLGLARKEESAAVHGRLLRAAVAANGADRSVISAIEKAMKNREKDLRLQAVVAAGRIQKRDKADKILKKALEDKESDVRTAAAYAIAGRRDPASKAVLEDAQKNEDNTAVSQWIAVALNVVGGESMDAFDAFEEKVLGDREPGWIQRMGRGRGRRGGEGEGEGGEGEGKAGEGKAGEGKSGKAGEGKDPRGDGRRRR